MNIEERFTATPEQEKLFKSVIRAIKKANKAGLYFYGKQESLVAYTEMADYYIDLEGIDKSCARGNRAVPYLSGRVLSDSGADDYVEFTDFDMMNILSDEDCED